MIYVKAEVGKAIFKILETAEQFMYLLILDLVSHNSYLMMGYSLPCHSRCPGCYQHV
jgi:hypothetical protein